jgi:hypothetical protein
MDNGCNKNGPYLNKIDKPFRQNRDVLHILERKNLASGLILIWLGVLNTLVEEKLIKGVKFYFTLRSNS